MPGKGGRPWRWPRAVAIGAVLLLGGCGWVWMERPPDVTEREEIAPSVGTVTPPEFAGEESRHLPGSPVTRPFRLGERVAERDGVSVNAGRAGKAAYFYTPDFHLALVAGSPRHRADDLAYAKGDWRIECGPGARPWACRLSAVSRVGPGDRTETALRVRYLPGGPGLVLCAGAEDADTPTLQTSQDAPLRYGGLDGCFSPADSADILGRLEHAESFGYQYTSGVFGGVSGWRTTFGLAEGLELMRWMHARETAQ
jgi:hypothetical protein